MTVQDHRELVAALLAVEGVADASVEPVAGGPGTLRLQLSPGSDEVRVAGAVNRLLRARFGLAVDADRVRVLDEPEPRAPAAPSAHDDEHDDEHGEHEPLDHGPHEHGPHEHGPHEHGPHDHGPHEHGPHDQGGEQQARANGAPGVYAGPLAGIADSEPTGGATRIESSLPEPGGAVVTGSDRVTVGLGGDPAGEMQHVRPARLAIKRVELVSAGLGVAVTVELGMDGRTITGAAEGAATQSGVHRSVAIATLRAVEGVLEGQVRFEVEHVELARTGPDQTVLVVLEMVTGRSTQRLSGASVVREDVRQAVVRAVLAAVNRRMEPMLVPS